MTGAQPPGDSLAVLIRAARQRTIGAEGRPLTQGQVADKLRHAHQQISQIETGAKTPRLDLLIRIYRVLQEYTPRGSASEDLSAWLVAWLREHAGRSTDGDPVVDEDIRTALGRLQEASHRRAAATATPGAPTPLGSLADFPGDDPFTVILGDRREWRAKSAADCLIYAGSTTDSMYLNLLGARLERAEIYSDKLVARLPIRHLRDRPELAERNLLVIGSPAANWGARILNRGAVFPFRIDQDVMERSAALLDEPQMQDATYASTFWKLAQGVRAGGDRVDIGSVNLDADEEPHADKALQLVHRTLQGSTAKAMMNKFRALGILDPADQENHGTNIHPANDFAVVSLARNPFSSTDRYRAVVCAGIHGPGTATALRELATNAERWFRTRPLGAVLEVRLNLDLAWSERIPKATVSVQTEQYEARTVLDHMDAALEQPADRRGSAFKPWDEESLRECAAFVRTVVGEQSDRDPA